MKASFRDLEHSEFYTIEFVWKPRWHSRLTGAGHFEMLVLTKPECHFQEGLAAHLHPGDRICVLKGYEPKTLERAKAIAMHWLRGYSIYCRTGNFPNGAAKINVV